jgi:hypothetical protein
MLQNQVGYILCEQSKQANGAEGQRLLAEAGMSVRVALEVVTRDEWPDLWAGVQDSLGMVLVEQAKHASGEETERLFAEAVQAVRSALEVIVRERSPEGWAEAQCHLGSALAGQGVHATNGPESERLLGEAAQAYREALAIRTRDDFPQDWAETSGYLKETLEDSGKRASGERAEKLRAEAEQIGRELKAFENRDGAAEDARR